MIHFSLRGNEETRKAQNMGLSRFLVSSHHVSQDEETPVGLVHREDADAPTLRAVPGGPSRGAA